MPRKGFFDLPGELRNQVYMEYLHEDGNAKYRPSKRELKLVGPPARISKLFREECESLLILHARIVHCKVNRFDFGPLITFLNTLDDTSLAATLQHIANLQQHQTPKAKSTLLPWTDREIVVHLDGSNQDSTRLLRWLNRFNVPEKGGTALQFSYTVLKDTEAHLYAASLSTCESWQTYAY